MPSRSSRRFARIVLAAAAIAACSGAATAQSRFAVGLNAGSPGLGGEVSFMASPHFTLRAGLDSLTYDGDIKGAVVTYKGDLKLQTGSLFVDWHPWANPWLVSAGAYIGTRQAGATPKLTAVSDIGGQTFTLDEVGVLQGKIKLDSFAPTLAAGWNNTFYNNRLGFKLLAGIVFSNQPAVSLTRTGGVALPPDVAARLQAALRAEEARLSDHTEILQYYPMLQAGVTYRF